MNVIKKQMGWYSLLVASTVPFFWLIGDSGTAAGWTAGMSFGYIVAWYYLGRYDRNYRKALIEALTLLPETGKDDPLTQFRCSLRKGIDDGLPITKMNRWLGYLEGALIEQGRMSIEERRNETRPHFGPLDFA